MEDRSDHLHAFIAASDWAGSRVEPLAGDASRRRYFRLIDAANERSAIVMDAPRALGEDVRPFLSVGAFLRDLGLSAPETFEADIDGGFLIIEDLGNALFDQVCAQTPQAESELYAAATDVLAELTTRPAIADVDSYLPHMTDLALSSLRWYVGGILGDVPEEADAMLRASLDPLLASLTRTDVTILRDYHAQNLVWLPERQGLRRVGLLDYQDAMTGPIVYDLMSLVKDARRDVSPQVRDSCIAQFGTACGIDAETLARECAIVSAQRNLRILMIFARMSLHFGKPSYVALLPRVWDHLMSDLAHPDLADLARAVNNIYPAPSAQALEVLRSKCGTVPKL